MIINFSKSDLKIKGLYGDGLPFEVTAGINLVRPDPAQLAKGKMPAAGGGGFAILPQHEDFGDDPVVHRLSGSVQDTDLVHALGDCL